MKSGRSTLQPIDHELARDAVAIIGIGCRFPGARGVEAFWRVLHDGIETTGDYTGGRFPYVDGVYADGTGIATRRGGFLPGLDRFDAEFFGISPREAALLDPQQRMLLEAAWEAVEDAGIPAAKIAGSHTGVFVGLWNNDYEDCLYERPEELDFYATTGGGRYPASGRLAYFLDLRGPNLTVDTACSSSLVAIHLACQSLRLGESEMALAGGANAILRPEITLTYSAANMLSPDGRSKFGDAAADGYVRSEGAGLILLKPLARALADGDPIYALIRASAVNNDGHSSGLLISPSREGQEALLRRAFRNAGIDPGEVDYIEAHGTGTLVGDPVEIETIGRVVDTPTRVRPCFLGSVKTNIGHTESAAGVAGVVKVALSLERGIIPASLHFREPNPAIKWDQFPVAVQRTTTPWPDSGPVHLAGVSGFGITGTNAHVVLENFEPVPSHAPVKTGEHLFLLSGHSSFALKDIASAWLDRTKTTEKTKTDLAWPSSLSDLAYTASVRRTHQDFRLAIVAANKRELQDRLSAWLKEEQDQHAQTGRRSLDRAKAVFVFPGQGGQWLGMTRGLMGEPAFQTTLAKCDEAIARHTGWSVTDRLLAAGPELMSEIDIVQPCLFAMMVSLAALWRSWGVEPEAVVGHSMGECAAAAVSGALSLEDAAAVICHRSRLMKRARGRGLMAVAELTMADAAALADRYHGRLSVAANNSPTSTVLSGDADAIEDALRELEAREVFCRRIKVDVASHCAHMDQFDAELKELLGGIRPRTGSLPIYSTTTGQIEDGSQLAAEYWSRNLRQPVLFSGAMQKLLQDGFNTFIEINAHPVLLQAVEDGIRHADRKAVAVASLRRDLPERAELLKAVGALHIAGFPVDFQKLYPEGKCLRLPPYAWQTERHWIESNPAIQRRSAPAAAFAADCAEDVYELRWIEQKTVPAGPKTSGIWIIAGAGVSDGIAAALTTRFQDVGEECVRVADAEELQRVLALSEGCCRGVIRLLGTTGSDARDAAVEAFDLVRTVRAVTSAAGSNAPRLWLVSMGVWHLQADTGEVSAAQSPAWGLGRVIAREHPELGCVNVDLSATADALEIDSLMELMRQNAQEEQLTIRGGQFFAARYERITESKPTPPPQFRSDATYLLTGGLGGIGLKVADWMTKQGARFLALVGRRAPDQATLRNIAALESLGVSVRVFSADLGDDAQVSTLLQEIEAEMPPLRGVFHLAVVTEGALLKDLEAESLDRVMRPKALGAWNLDRHLGNRELDFFVLFSSIAAAISQPGLASYATANAYVDALARHRRAKGLKAQSIQWSPWLATGLGNDEKVQRGVRVYLEMGVRPLAVEGALRGLGRIMAFENKDALVLPVEWEQFGRSFENGEAPRAFIDLLPKKESAASAATAESIRDQLMDLEAGRRRTALEWHLQEKLSAVLKTDAARLDPAKPFGSMGVDSLMALEFVRRLSLTTGLRLPATAVFNYPTIHALASEISRRMEIPLDGPAGATSRPETREAPSPVADTSLTDEEAIEILAGRGTRH